MADIILGVEKMYGAKIKLDYNDGYPPTINNKDCTKTVLKNATKIVFADGNISAKIMLIGRAWI